MIPQQKIHIIPNGVDTNIPSKDLGRAEVRRKYSINENDKVVTFVGNLEINANFIAAKYIADKLAPEVFSRFPANVQFMMIGRYTQLPKTFLIDKRVILTNFVEDIAPYMNTADICIAPLEVGSGTKTKLFLYMAYGKPIITTEIGKEGINITHGQEAIVANLDFFPYELINLIQDENLCQEIGKRARIKVVQEYDWSKHSSDLDKILHGLHIKEEKRQIV